MTETELIEAIDCQLPYDDLPRIRSIVEQAKNISANAVFMVLHEICRPPQSRKLEMSAQLTLLNAWAQAVEHPLAAVVLPIAEAMIRNHPVSICTSMAAMQEVAKFQNQFNALAIPYFACDDVDGAVDTLHTSIMQNWNAA